MAPTHPRTGPTPAEAAGRAFLTALTLLAVVGLVVGTLYGLLLVAKGPSWGPTGYHFDVAVATPPGVQPRVAGSEASTYVAYGTVHVSSHAPLVVSRTLSTVAALAPVVVFLAACLLVLVLARRLRAGHPFSRPAVWTVGVLGAVVAVLGVVRPLFEALAVQRAVAELGLVTMPPDPVPEGTPLPAEWVVPPYWDWMATDWPTLILGVALCLVAWLLARGLRQQRDVEGLV